MTKRTKIKRKIKQLTRSDFDKILSELMLSESQNKLMLLTYQEHKSQDYIADSLGVGIPTVKLWHSMIIDKIIVSGLLEDGPNL